MMRTPTVLPDRMQWDVAVIGAGPAGSLAAGHLARSGRSVLLIDRHSFPRHKVCGGCLNRRAVSALVAAGHETLLQELSPTTVDAIEITAGGRSVRLPLPEGLAVSREALDHALRRAAEAAGATVLEGWSAAVETGNACGWMVSLRASNQKRRFYARSCIVAAGLVGRGTLGKALEPQISVMRRSRVGAGVILAAGQSLVPPGTISMTVSSRGYVGIAAVEGGRTAVAAALDSDAVRTSGGIGPLVCRILERRNEAIVQRFAEAEWTGTPALTRNVHPLAAHRLLVVGDAAGYAEPFTGEGMAWAMTTGCKAGALIDQHLDDWESDTTAEWLDWHRRNVGRYQKRCRRLAQALRRPWFVGLGLSALRHVPSLAKPLIQSLHSPLEPPAPPGMPVSSSHTKGSNQLYGAKSTSL